MNIQDDRVLRYKQAGDIRLKCSLNLKQLFREPKQRRIFDQKWPEFLASHENNKDFYTLKGDTLEYFSEQLIPDKPNFEAEEHIGSLHFIQVDFLGYSRRVDICICQQYT